MVFEDAKRHGRVDDATIQDGNDDYDFETDPGRGTAVDAKLFKAIGLHHLLLRWPADPDGRGDGNPYRRTLRVALWLWFGVQLVQLVGLYYLRTDVERFALTSVLVTTSFLCLFKGYVMAWYGDRLRAVLWPVAGREDDDWLHRCRAKVFPVVRMFAAFSCGTCVLWLAAPWVLIATRNDARYVRFTWSDGTVSEYRVSMFNIWLPMSEAVYNQPVVWFCVYVFEAFGCSLDVFAWLSFDCYVITMCYTLHAQFRNVSDGYATLGHARHSAVDQTGSVAGGVTGLGVDTYHYNELIRHIKGNQKILKKFDDFFDLVRPVVLAQICLNSYTVVITIFIASLTYIMGSPILSVPFVRIFGAFCTLTLEHYLYCYLFDYVESAKVTMNFGMYSCNWTEMSLKFKKTLLLGMSLNASHRRTMKVSPMTIVNLEMFTGVMRMSFSIVSVLLNFQK